MRRDLTGQTAHDFRMQNVTDAVSGVDIRLIKEQRIIAALKAIPDDEEAEGKHDGCLAMLDKLYPGVVRADMEFTRITGEPRTF